jgi:electron transfer flavoprotein alpha subunit
VIAVVPVRAGDLPVGTPESITEAGGRVLLVGDGCERAAAALTSGAGGAGVCVESEAIAILELGVFAPGRFARVLAPVVERQDVVVLPAAPDGRDLAPRLAAELGRPLLAGAVSVDGDGATVARHGGRQLVRLDVEGAFVATVQPGVAPLLPAATPATGTSSGAGTADISRLEEPLDASPAPPRDAEVLDVLAPDPSVVDLAEAPRIFAGGAGLGGVEEFALLARVAARLGASVGATRVVTDGGLLPHDRQIGTTGVVVRPRCYVALGISGAAQHLGGIGDPDHVIALNLDSSCPMMATADVAIVSDAPTTLDALARLLGIGGRSGSVSGG